MRWCLDRYVVYLNFFQHIHKFFHALIIFFSGFQVERTLSRAAYGIVLYLKKGCRKAARWMLRGCRAELEDVGQVYRLQDFYMAHNFNPAVENEPDSPEDDVLPAPPSLDEAGDMWRTYIPPIPSAYQYPTHEGDEGDEGDVTRLGSPGQESPAGASASQEATPSTGPTAKRLRRASRRHRGEPADKYTPS
jgi:hypothetical protein